MVPNVAWSTSMSRPCDRVCSHSYTSRMVRIRPAGTPIRSSFASSSSVEYSANGGLHQFVDALAVGHPLRVRRHSWRVGIETEAVAEPLPQPLAADRDLHGAVGGIEQAVRADRRMVVTRRLADLARHRPLRALERVHPDDRGEQRRTNHLATARPLALLQRGEDTERAVHAGQQVGDRHADALKVGRPRAGHRHQTRFTLGDLVVTGPPGLRPVVTETADGQDDQTRVELSHALLGEAEPVQDARPEVLHEHVGAANQSLQGGLAGVGP